MEHLTRHIAAVDVDHHAAIADTLVLPFEQRQKARQRARLASGTHVGVQLPRGTLMRGGDRLVSESGKLIDVVAAPEPVSTVRTEDALLLARAAFHLGNRHVWVQIGQGWLSYLNDHVLDELVRGLGLTPENGCVPFEPEGGAYGSHHHDHDH